VSFQSPSAALVLTYVSFGRGTGGSSTFTEVEERTVANAMRTAELRRTGSPPFDSSLQFTATVPLGTPPPPPDGPRRVGGNIRQPQRIQDAPGILPDVARQAGITGVVILEITIGTDGAVKDARVVRSIPLLDQAALDAARQWKFEVTQLNGVPVPVIMTATVNFR
jgi:TonB family protein